jgi:hypothetical protein
MSGKDSRNSADAAGDLLRQAASQAPTRKFQHALDGAVGTLARSQIRLLRWSGPGPRCFCRGVVGGTGCGSAGEEGHRNHSRSSISGPPWRALPERLTVPRKNFGLR